MKILFTVQKYWPEVGGSEVVVQQLAERFVRRGHDVTVATGRTNGQPSMLNDVRIKSFEITGSTAYASVRGETSAYQGYLRRGKFDIVCNYAAQIWPSDLTFPLLKDLRAKTVFITCGFSALNMPKSTVVEYFKNVERVLPRYDQVVIISRLNRDYKFCVRHGIENVTVIPNGVCLEEFAPKPFSPFKERYGIKTPHMLLTVANFYPGKGHMELAEVMRSLKRDDTTLVVIARKAEGVFGDFNRRIGGLPVRTLTGIPRGDVVDAYHACDVFVLASQFEVGPLVLLEAMAAGKPFVSSNCGNAEELPGGVVIESLDDSYVLNSRPMHLNGKQLRRWKEVLDDLLDSRVKRDFIGRQGRKAVEGKFNWEALVSEYETLFLELLGKGGT